MPLATTPMRLERIELTKTKGLQPLVEPTLERWFSADFQASHPQLIAEIRDMIVETSVAGFCGACHAIKDLSLRADLVKITLPTLVLVGENDPGTPVMEAEKICRQIKSSELVILPRA